MSDPQNPKSPENLPPPPPPTNTPKLPPNGSSGIKFSGHFPNPPDPTIPDPATLRDQWRYAIKQYSRWYSQAWGTAILAGLSFFALGWIIKGSNPLPSFRQEPPDKQNASSSSSDKVAAERKQGQ